MYEGREMMAERLKKEDKLGKYKKQGLILWNKQMLGLHDMEWQEDLKAYNNWAGMNVDLEIGQIGSGVTQGKTQEVIRGWLFC